MTAKDVAILRLVKVTDGDTLTAHIEVPAGELDDFDLFARSKPDKPARLRLVHLDTPEKGHAGYADAGRDLADWLGDGTGLRMTYEIKDTFGRYVADVYREDNRADTASDHMVRVRRWPVWTR